jgi:hypothetical protein
MKTKIPALLATMATLSLAPLAHAGENHSHAHEHGSKVELTIPEKLSDLWKSIEADHSALSTAIAQKDIPAAHAAEQRLQALLKAIPEKTSALEESARTRIDGQAKNLARAYDGVHHASDHKEWDKAEASLKKADGGLQLLGARLKALF